MLHSNSETEHWKMYEKKKRRFFDAWTERGKRYDVIKNPRSCYAMKYLAKSVSYTAASACLKTIKKYGYPVDSYQITTAATETTPIFHQIRKTSTDSIAVVSLSNDLSLVFELPASSDGVVRPYPKRTMQILPSLLDFWSESVFGDVITRNDDATWEIMINGPNAVLLRDYEDKGKIEMSAEMAELVSRHESHNPPSIIIKGNTSFRSARELLETESRLQSLLETTRNLLRAKK